MISDQQNALQVSHADLQTPRVLDGHRITALVHNRLDLAQPLSQLKDLPPLLDEISPEILQPAARARQPQQPRFDPSPRGALQRAWVRG